MFNVQLLINSIISRLYNKIIALSYWILYNDFAISVLYHGGNAIWIHKWAVGIAFPFCAQFLFLLVGVPVKKMFIIPKKNYSVHSSDNPLVRKFLNRLVSLVL